MPLSVPDVNNYSHNSKNHTAVESYIPINLGIIGCHKKKAGKEQL
jgi:hypothetical protein